jgi:hypothetical protein
MTEYQELLKLKRFVSKSCVGCKFSFPLLQNSSCRCSIKSVEVEVEGICSHFDYSDFRTEEIRKILERWPGLKKEFKKKEIERFIYK